MKKKKILMRILILQGMSLGQIMYWDKEQPLRFHVIEKSSGKRFPHNFHSNRHHHQNHRCHCCLHHNHGTTSSLFDSMWLKSHLANGLLIIQTLWHHHYHANHHHQNHYDPCCLHHNHCFQGYHWTTKQILWVSTTSSMLMRSLAILFLMLLSRSVSKNILSSCHLMIICKTKLTFKGN